MSGLRAWLIQRLSAVYMGVYLLLFLIHMLIDAPADYQDWRVSLADPWVALAMLLFFAALFMHVWVGIRDVILDYVRWPGLRLLLLSLTGLALLACGLWVVEILFAVME
jgi:succinate dehydrogenase / fumarate reductase membrane anchor subunit